MRAVQFIHLLKSQFSISNESGMYCTSLTYMMVRIEESLSSGNLTVVQGETVMLVCTVLNLGDKSVN